MAEVLQRVPAVWAKLAVEKHISEVKLEAKEKMIGHLTLEEDLGFTKLVHYWLCVTDMLWSKHSTSYCDGGWTWSTWRTSPPRPPSPRRPRTWSQTWATLDCSPLFRTDSGGRPRALPIPCTGDRRSPPEFMRSSQISGEHFKLSYLQSHHECDPLIKGSVWGVILSIRVIFYKDLICHCSIFPSPHSPCPLGPRYIWDEADILWECRCFHESSNSPVFIIMVMISTQRFYDDTSARSWSTPENWQLKILGDYLEIHYMMTFSEKYVEGNKVILSIVLKASGIFTWLGHQSTGKQLRL